MHPYWILYVCSLINLCSFLWWKNSESISLNLQFRIQEQRSLNYYALKFFGDPLWSYFVVWIRITVRWSCLQLTFVTRPMYWAPTLLLEARAIVGPGWFWTCPRVERYNIGSWWTSISGEVYGNESVINNLVYVSILILSF
jgi:hypothetical protein